MAAFWLIPDPVGCANATWIKVAQKQVDRNVAQDTSGLQRGVAPHVRLAVGVHSGTDCAAPDAGTRARGPPWKWRLDWEMPGDATPAARLQVQASKQQNRDGPHPSGRRPPPVWFLERGCAGVPHPGTKRADNGTPALLLPLETKKSRICCIERVMWLHCAFPACRRERVVFIPHIPGRNCHDRAANESPLGLVSRVT